MEVGDFVQSIEDRYSVKLFLHKQGELLVLSSIVVPNNERGIGIGSEVMSEIADYADEVNLPVYLTPSTGLGATSVARLKKFYKRFGFKNKPRSDFSRRESMVRYPDSI
jgi:GNAT superfamily N-acetyltransferase